MTKKVIKVTVGSNLIWEGDNVLFGTKLVKGLIEDGNTDVNMSIKDATKLTCTVEDIVDFITTEMNIEEECRVTIGSATWYVVE